MPAELYIRQRGIIPSAPGAAPSDLTLAVDVVYEPAFSAPQLLLSAVRIDGSPISDVANLTSDPFFYTSPLFTAPNPASSRPEGADSFVMQQLAVRISFDRHPVTHEPLFVLHGCSSPDLLAAIIPPLACVRTSTASHQDSAVVAGGHGEAPVAKCGVCWGCNVIRWFLIAVGPTVGVEVGYLR